MARTQLFAQIRAAMARARETAPDLPPPQPRAINRRTALLLISAAACTPSGPSQGPDAGRVAIVGGGTSGLVVAWRLANAGVASEIFESSGRTGGRMFTLRDFTPEGQFCELGGELVDTGHTALISLCRELGLSMQRLRPEGAEGSDIYDLGGKPRLAADLLDPMAKSGAFIPVAVRIAADQAALLDAEQNWTARAKELDALPLSKYLESLSSSAERWVIDLIALAYHAEFGIPVDRQSSLNLVDLIGAEADEPFRIFGDSDEALRIAGGSGTLPETLTTRLSAQPLNERTAISLRHELTAIARDADGFRLTFRNEAQPPAERTFGRVVLALPFTRLREVKGLGGLGISAAKMQAINELGYGVNSKLMVGTTSRPWNASLLGFNSPLSGTIYSDRGFQIVWDTSAGQAGVGGILTNFLTGASAIGEEAPALARLQEGLGTLSPDLARALNPAVRASFFWPNHPHTKGSYSGCLAGQYTTLPEETGKSELGGSLVFAGEHTAGADMGFMNGAVVAGERAARQLLTAT